MRAFSRACLGVVALTLCGALFARAEKIPPAPARHFNDYARVVPGAVAQRLDERLAQFERESSNQLVVAVYPRMDSASSVEDFTVRVAQSWRVGRKNKDNGAVLFVFVEDRQVYLSVGYGLEGALPDALAFQIVDREIKPRFRSGDYAGGLTAAVEAMIAATRGEYRGSGRTAGEAGGRAPQGRFSLLFTFVVFLLIVGSSFRAMKRGSVLGNPYHRRRHSPFDHHGTGWWGGGGGGWGGGFGGGGGGFSGGGGSFGGGGAGGKW